MAKSTWLLDYAHSVHSQTGEDGIIEKILSVLPDHDKWCVEFGAGDGLRFSNTRHLIESKGYSAVLIEANKKSFARLQRNCSQWKGVIAFNDLVGFTPENGLDTILKRTEIPPDFDLLSIDIDGNDYHVWKALGEYRPKIVVIEFNPTIPTPVRFVQPAKGAVQQGASLRSLAELGREKGYELVCVLAFNAFFVRKEDYGRFDIECNEPEVLRTDNSMVTYLFSGFDGTLFLDGARRLPWHQIRIKARQELPRFIRTFPRDYTAAQRIAYLLYRALRKT